MFTSHDQSNIFAIGAIILNLFYLTITQFATIIKTIHRLCNSKAIKEREKQ